LGSRLSASDDELPKFAGRFALESIEFLDMARGDLHESLQHRIEHFQGAFDHDPYAAIVEIFNQPTDGVLPGKIVDRIPHADSLHTATEETGQSLHGSTARMEIGWVQNVAWKQKRNEPTNHRLPASLEILKSKCSRRLLLLFLQRDLGDADFGHSHDDRVFGPLVEVLETLDALGSGHYIAAFDTAGSNFQAFI